MPYELRKQWSAYNVRLKVFSPIYKASDNSEMIAFQSMISISYISSHMNIKYILEKMTKQPRLAQSLLFTPNHDAN